MAELGDKTQIATLCFATGKNTQVPVFIGSSLALVTSSLLACLLGGALTRVVPTRWIHVGAGVIFIIIGFVLVAKNVRSA